MAKIYNMNNKPGKFFSALEQYNALVSQLQSGETANMEHGDIEKLIHSEGLELLRRLLQGHLDLRAERESKQEAIIGSDGVIRNHCRTECSRNIESIFGEVTVKRFGYSTRGEQSIFPMDQELNLPTEKYSHGLQEHIANTVIKNSFADAVDDIARTTGGKVPKRQMEEISSIISQDFERYYETHKFKFPEITKDILVISLDGKGIVMHQKDLRDLTRKAAERAKSKPKSYRLGKGEKRNRKRMATVATVYTINHYNRAAEEIMGINKRDDENPQPRAKHKRVWASVERDPLEVAEEAFKEALRRDPNNEREWVVLVDGDRYQIERIYSLIDKYQIDAVVILDYIHVLEYLWKAAYCFNKENSVEAEKWVAKRGLNILKGKAIDVAAGMRRSATLRNLTKEQRKSVDKCANYLLTYSNLLFYDHYIESGFPIATGVIEGACRHLIKDRMDITGARWGLKSAEAVLKLRSLYSSGDLDEYMVFHNNQELKRNHFSQHLDIQHQKAA